MENSDANIPNSDVGLAKSPVERQGAQQTSVVANDAKPRKPRSWRPIALST